MLCNLKSSCFNYRHYDFDENSHRVSIVKKTNVIYPDHMMEVSNCNSKS